jgi:hypothetical protein
MIRSCLAIFTIISSSAAYAQNFNGLWAKEQRYCNQRSIEPDTWMRFSGSIIVGNNWKCFMQRKQGSTNFSVVYLACGYDRTDIMFNDVVTITQQNNNLIIKYDQGTKTFVKCAE